MLLFFFVVIISTEGFSGGAVVKNLPTIARGTSLILVRKDPLEEYKPPREFLPAEFHGHRSLVGYSPEVTKSWTQLSTHTYLSILSNLFIN